MTKHIALYGMLFLLLAGFTANVFAFTKVYSTDYSRFKSIINGDLAKIIEDQYNKKIFIYDNAIQIWSRLIFNLFRQGDDGVFIGVDNWLFTSDEFTITRDSMRHYNAHLDFIYGAHKSLRQKNIDLFIVPVPVKAEIYENKLGSIKIPQARAELYNDFLRKLEKNSIHACPIKARFLSGVCSGSLFLETDTHWTPQGAYCAAQQIASCLDLLSLPAPSSSTEVSSHRGDLVRYLPGAQHAYPNENFAPLVLPVAPRAINNSDDLFGDNKNIIMLVGTSYSANKTWQFHDLLQYTLSQNISNASDEGHGPFHSMARALESIQNGGTAPRLIIWEIPVRYLLQNNDNKSENESAY